MGLGAAFPRTPVAELLLSCVLEPDPSNPGRFVTADAFYPCPWGRENFASYQNRNERECGNGTVDLGEECDAGYSGGPTGGETCDTLGLGPGMLACDARCDFERAACASSACGAFADGAVRVRGGAPAAARLSITLGQMQVAGRTFDPVADGLDLTLRSAAGVVYTARLPGGASWRGAASGWTYTGDVDGISTLRLRRTGALGVRINGPIDGTLGAVVAVVARIGDDCWRGELSCDTRGAATACTKRRRP